jgi:hypothetical protein
MKRPFLLFLVLSAFFAPARAAVGTYVLDQRGSAKGGPTEIQEFFRRLYIDGASEDALWIAWEADCGQTVEGMTPFHLQIVIEARSAALQAEQERYLKDHQDFVLDGKTYHFRRAIHLRQEIAFESGTIAPTGPWKFEPLETSVYHGVYPGYGAYRAFYSRLTAAFWFLGPRGFADFFIPLFDKEYADRYFEKTLPRINGVATRTLLDWKLEDGAEVRSVMIYDILHDCRPRENGRCR